MKRSSPVHTSRSASSCCDDVDRRNLQGIGSDHVNGKRRHDTTSRKNNRLSVSVVACRSSLAVLSLGFVIWYFFTGSSDDSGTASPEGRHGWLRSASLPDNGTSIVAVSNSSSSSSSAPSHNDDFCTLYMAPSTIANAGFGVFTAKSFASGDVIKLQDGPSIPFTDPYKTTKRAPHLRVLGDKWWAELKGMPNAMRFEAESVMEYVAGFGSLPNFHPALENINPREPMQAVNDGMLDRRRSYGAGASTVYTGKDIYAERDIVAGEELFLDYGESYFDHEPEVYEDVPRLEDYEDASSFLVNFADELRQAAGLMAEGSPEEKAFVEKMFAKMKNGIAEAYSSRSASLIPETYDELVKIAKEASDAPDAFGRDSDDDPDEAKLRFALAREMSTHHVTPSWLRSYGMCLDNVVRKLSTIPEAGAGGFASRSLKSGETIVPVPLYHVANRDLLRTYPIHIDKDTGKFYRNVTRLDQPQLLQNYCFGHDESTLLLCPITSVMHLNHCSMRRNGGNCGTNVQAGPNAKLRWGTRWHPETAQWLEKSAEEIAASKDRVVNLEIVATRHIDDGEEIFIDYGEEWENAWENHIKEWMAPTEESSTGPHDSVIRLNDDMVDPKPTNDLRNDRSPPGDVMTACWYVPGKGELLGRKYRRKISHDSDEDGYDDDDDDDDTDDDGYDDDDDTDDDDTEEDEEEEKRRRLAEERRTKGPTSWKDFSDEEIMDRYSRDGRRFTIKNNNAVHYPNFWPCSIVSKDKQRANNSTEVTYTVRIFPSKSHPTPKWRLSPNFLTNYRRSSIRYFHKPYRSDLYLPGAFRRFIGIDDAIFPDKWRNRKAFNIQETSADTFFRAGDRVSFYNRTKVGIVLDYRPGKGYDIVSLRSKQVREGVQSNDMELNVHIEELNLDPVYA